MASSSSAHHLLQSGGNGWFLAITVLVLLLQKTYSSCPAVLCDCSGYNTHKTIRCNLRDLTDVPLELPADTKHLRLEYNSLTKLAAASFLNLSRLEKLYLYNNDINVIEDGAFRGLSSLVYLDMTTNRISEITNMTFAGAPKLEELVLRNNRLTELPRGAFSQLPRLSSLDLAANNLNEFPADVTQDLVNLKELKLSKNPVTLAASFGQQLQALEKLYLRNITNAMGQFSVPDSAFDGLVNLVTVELQENFLTEIPQAVKSLPNLLTIRLENNLIRNVKDGDFHDPSPLQDLYLHYNSLVALPTSGLAKLPRLASLVLDYNSLSTVPARSFVHNTRLEDLSMYSTGISSIDKDAFQGLRNLTKLGLGENSLTTLVDGVFDNLNPDLQVFLAGNPLLCDCNLRAFGDWLKNNTLSPKTFECAAPERLQGTRVVDVEPVDFACRPRLLTDTIYTASAIQGTDVPLPCGIEADPIVDIYWITSNRSLVYPHQPKPGLYFLSRSNGTLMVTAVSLTDRGSYTCVVKNSAGEMSNSITLEVLMPAAGTPSHQDTMLTQSPGGQGGVVYGIGGGAVALVVVLVLIATIAVHRKKNRPPEKQKIPLPLTPGFGTTRENCNSEMYEEIPCELYSTHISHENPSLEEKTTPADYQHIAHTYLDPKKNNNREGEVPLKRSDKEKCVVDLSNESNSRYATVEQSNPTAHDEGGVVHTYLDPNSEKNKTNQPEGEVSCRWDGNNVVDLSNDSPRYSTTGPSNQTGGYMTMEPLPHPENK
ncbi:carboxypeptidase N subunit 2-like [Asterias rubens]|uniref:carboxypeptidase N subunit 2-like n=1 Tax=Asterias rubens TaxID=7604 RepID=UPI000FECAC6A|nr:carboxypeptidase N subunit 2-like [Asterias rubens]